MERRVKVITSKDMGVRFARSGYNHERFFGEEEPEGIDRLSELIEETIPRREIGATRVFLDRGRVVYTFHDRDSSKDSELHLLPKHRQEWQSAWNARRKIGYKIHAKK